MTNMYQALVIGLPDSLFISLQALVAQYHLQFTAATTLQSASQLLSSTVFHILIVNMDYLRNIQQVNWLSNLRHISFAPVIVLSEAPEQDLTSSVELGADICVSSKLPHTEIAGLIHAQLRRYTEYNHYDNPNVGEVAAFQKGDIFIDPARYVVKVRGRLVNLRPREFSLLLYFMRNPGVVLASERICEQAWGMEMGYNRGVAQPIHLLRQAIEPDPENPIYIHTVYRKGYCFTANNVETCDKC